MRVARQMLIGREPGEVFALASDPERLRDFFVGISRWEPRSRKRRGVGARYRVLMRVGSIEAGGTVRITEWVENELVAWESEDGIEHRGRWTLRPASAGTNVALEIDFRLHGPLSWLVERLAGRIVDRNVLATLLAVRRIVELEPRAARR